MRRPPVATALLALLSLAACRTAERVEPDPAPPATARATPLRVERVRVGLAPTNAYVVWSDGSRDALVIDPGADAGRIRRVLDAHGLVCRTIALTHGHGDHTGACLELAASTGAEVCRHPADGDPRPPSLSPGFGPPRIRDLRGGEVLAVGGLPLTVLPTPGHSPGSVSLLGPGVLFCGDLLFHGNVGRTDLPGGSEADLRRSLLVGLREVPDDTRVLPGHGEETVLGAERRANPWFRP
jgi:glyoxylase-like metal-dependent hydrolase (beta-lactamase superfamily II)